MRIKIREFTNEGFNFCKEYINNFPINSEYPKNLTALDAEIKEGKLDDNEYDISPNENNHWPYLFIAERYVQIHKSKSAGRRRSNKPSIRRRRSSKARKSRKSRNTRRR